MKDIDSRFAKTLEIVKETGDMVWKRQFEDFKVGFKGNRLDPVTEIDKMAQKKILDFIVTEFPGDNFLGEEDGYDKTPVDCEHLWIVDPIDGTANFMHGLPLWCVSVAFYSLGKPLFGVVYAPALNQMFKAKNGNGAYLNDKQINVSDIQNLEESCLSTGLTDLIRNSKEEKLGNLITDAFSSAQRMRFFGTAALQICYVASGWTEGFFETTLKPWDVAAAVLILKEAGGCSSDMSGNTYSLSRRDIVSSNEKVQGEILKLIERNFDIFDK